MAGPPPPQPRSNRRARLDPEVRRAQIIQAAGVLLESEGLEAMTIEEVADAAGVSRSLVYTYFGDRDGVVAEVYLRVLNRIERDAPPALGRGIPDSRRAVVDYIGACLRFAEAHPAAWRLLVTDSVRRHPLVAGARRARIAQVTADMGGAGPPLVADASWGLVESGVLHWVEQPDLPLETAAEVLATTLWSGLAGIRERKTKKAPVQELDSVRGDGIGAPTAPGTERP